LHISQSIQSTILGDSNGDALDSIVAAFATFRVFRSQTLLSPLGNGSYYLEGYVYA